MKELQWQLLAFAPGRRRKGAQHIDNGFYLKMMGND